MADITVTAANVLARSGATIEQHTAAEAITAGQSIYQSSSNSNWGKAQADGTADESGNTGLGVAVTSAPGASQPLLVFRAGTIKIGGTVATGTHYAVSNTAGGIAPDSDIGVGGYATMIGIGINTTDIKTPNSGCWSAAVAKA